MLCIHAYANVSKLVKKISRGSLQKYFAKKLWNHLENSVRTGCNSQQNFSHTFPLVKTLFFLIQPYLPLFCPWCFSLLVFTIFLEWVVERLNVKRLLPCGYKVRFAKFNFLLYVVENEYFGLFFREIYQYSI